VKLWLTIYSYFDVSMIMMNKLLTKTSLRLFYSILQKTTLKDVILVFESCFMFHTTTQKKTLRCNVLFKLLGLCLFYFIFDFTYLDNIINFLTWWWFDMDRKLVLINIINKTLHRLHLKVFFWNIKHDSNKLFCLWYIRIVQFIVDKNENKKFKCNVTKKI